MSQVEAGLVAGEAARFSIAHGVGVINRQLVSSASTMCSRGHGGRQGRNLPKRPFPGPSSPLARERSMG
jgi:hypothetical protein